MARFAHTGEVGGIVVQALAGLITLGGALLVGLGFLAPAQNQARRAADRRRRLSRDLLRRQA